jgi:Xaa-Pro aminopeptidase
VIRPHDLFLTPLEIDRIRTACQAGVWIHVQVPQLLTAGMTERELHADLANHFATANGEGYGYQPDGAWDVRSRISGDSNVYHAAVTDRRYRRGD